MPVNGVTTEALWRILVQPRALVVRTPGGSKPAPAPSPPAPPPKPAPKPPPSKPKTRVVEYELLELVETVTYGSEQPVTGAGMATADTVMFPTATQRTERDGGDYQQYINLSRGLGSWGTPRPEFGREISLRARVKQKDGLTDQLAGVGVTFKFTRTDGPDRTNPGGTAPAVWTATPVSGTQQEGFGSAGGAAERVGRTDDKGWTEIITFVLSNYAGDKFQLTAELAPGTAGVGPPALKTSGAFVVWRRFWYQLTHANGFAPPSLAAGTTAYRDVGAEMVHSNSKAFVKADLPAALQTRTFMPKYMLEKSGGADVVAVIGGHNKKLLAAMMTTEASHPLKANLIVCEFQCDPAGPSPLQEYKLTKPNQSIRIAAGSGGSIVSNPALKPGADLVISGAWATTHWPIFITRGALTDANIEIDPARGSTKAVTIHLPPDAPVPTVDDPVYIRLQVHTANGYLGESFGKGQILCVYRPAAPAGAQGSQADFNDTVAHELGHMWNQTPESAAVPPSMKSHALQYVGHGGMGPHCRHGATVGPGVVNWQNADQETPTPEDGDCIMYHSYSSKCAHHFCATCKPYLRLQDMSTL
jgi:hypothetical protein